MKLSTPMMMRHPETRERHRFKGHEELPEWAAAELTRQMDEGRDLSAVLVEEAAKPKPKKATSKKSDDGDD